MDDLPTSLPSDGMSGVQRDFVVRRATVDDLGKLSLIWLETMEILAQADPHIKLMPYANTQWVIAARTWVAQENVAIFMAERKDAALAYIIGEIRPNTPGLLPEQIGVVTELAADSHGRGEGGIGRTLLNALRGWFTEHGIRSVQTTIPKRHPIAQAFWRASGGVLIEETFWLK